MGMDLGDITRIAQQQAQAAVAAAKAAHEVKQQAAAAAQQQADDAAARWEKQAQVMEDALEHAGISGVDVQIDASGNAKLVGDVAGEAGKATAAAIAEQFPGLTSLDVQLKVVEAPAAQEAEDQSSIWDKVKAGAADKVVYKTKPGDSWWGIAAKFYNDGTQWKRLKRANGWPKMLHPNVDVTVPSKDELAKFPAE